MSRRDAIILTGEDRKITHEHVPIGNGWGCRWECSECKFGVWYFDSVFGNCHPGDSLTHICHYNGMLVERSHHGNEERVIEL